MTTPIRLTLLSLALCTALMPQQSLAQNSSAAALVENSPDLYIIGLKQAPLALYEGQNRGFAAIPRKADNKLDFTSPEAVNYQNALKSEQASFLQKASSALDRNVKVFAPEFQFQHAFNGAYRFLNRYYKIKYSGRHFR